MLFDFLFSDFFRQSLVSAAVDIHSLYRREREKVFGLNTL